MHDIDPILVQNESLSCIFTFEQCSQFLHGHTEIRTSGLFAPLPHLPHLPHLPQKQIDIVIIIIALRSIWGTKRDSAALAHQTDCLLHLFQPYFHSSIHPSILLSILPHFHLFHLFYPYFHPYFHSAISSIFYLDKV